MARRKTTLRTIHIIPTQHLDVAWLWKRTPEGEELMRACFERALELIAADPTGTFVFSRSTAWSFAIVEERWPELFKRVAAAVRAGRVEPCGAQWVEPDNVIPDGESMLRQCLYAQHYYRTRFGKTSRICWNPDVFAHGANLPQILRHCGVDGYYFHRCRPEDKKGRQRTQFRWQGVDGSEVLAYTGHWQGMARTADDLESSRGDARQAGVPDTYAVTGRMSDRRITMDISWVKEAPEHLARQGETVRWSGAEDMLDAMQAYRADLPVVAGELACAYTGTLTSDMTTKHWNRRLEGLLAETEAFCAQAALLGHAYPTERLRGLWQDLCVNHFHDIICGTCYRHVQEEGYALYAAIEKGAQALRYQALKHIGAVVEGWTPGRTGQQIILANSLAWSRAEPAAVPLEPGESLAVLDGAGKPVASQTVTEPDGSQALLFVPPEAVPAMGAQGYGVAPDRKAGKAAGRKKRSLAMANEALSLRIDAQTGALASLKTVAGSREWIRKESLGNHLLFEQDACRLRGGMEHGWQPWYLGRTGRQYSVPVISVERLEDGPVRSRIRVTHRGVLPGAEAETVLRQDYLLYRGWPVLVVETTGDWQAVETMVRAEFAFAFRPQTVVRDLQYAAVERPASPVAHVERYNPEDMGQDVHRIPEPDLPFQKWLDLTDGKRGVTVFSDGPGAYEADRHRLRLSLLRSGQMRPGEIAGLGPVHFRYGIMPHEGSWQEADVVRLSYAFQRPLIGQVVKRSGTTSVPPVSFFQVQAPNVLHTVFKGAEDGDGWILRLHETAGLATQTDLNSKPSLAELVECNGIEEPVVPPSGTVRTLGPFGVALSFRPFEIKTLRLRFN